MRPNWEYDENKSQMMMSPKPITQNQFRSLTHSNANNKFRAILDFNGTIICTGEADNKKAARERCARHAICIVALTIYRTRFSPEEPGTDPLLFQQHIMRDLQTYK